MYDDPDGNLNIGQISNGINNEVNNTTTTIFDNNIDSNSSGDYSKYYTVNSIEESSFFVSKKKKNKKTSDDEMKYVEISPNSNFRRSDQRKYIEKYHIGYAGLDINRSCEIIWHELNVSFIDDEQKENLYREIVRLKGISKEECLNTILDVWLREDKRVIVFITDCFGMKTLRQYLSIIGKQKLKVIKNWIRILLKSLTFLHRSKLIFGGLNCSLILFKESKGELAIKDLFAASNVFYKSYNEKPSELFPPNCMAPELITSSKLKENNDIYSLGMVIIEIITLRVPYSKIESKKEIMAKIAKGVLPQEFDCIMDDTVKKFLMKMIAKDPKNRSSIDELLNDEFLKITKEDNRIIKVKNMKYKKNHKTNYNNVDYSVKNFLPYKEFKEDPYTEESRKIINDHRILFDDNNINNIIKHKINDEVIDSNSNISDNFEKEYENVRAKSDDSDYIGDKYNGIEEQEEIEQNYHIMDDEYNVHLKILINEDGKMNEIQFTYNLLKDSIDNLMEEVKKEFNLTHENLNHIYETLKKVHIYSKLCKESELLPNNSF